ncbi:ribosome-associated heat shock protein Hsp15 [Aliiglaciecola sp. CAU 1673]|uniref:ribosome-associated heat shock protein Hsp15 n=1 Tax=Aliiglaciecola sp. CAU 1673 TaxID=3032595 RepID=UPI0023DCCC68|nr:ribosome-associated heat shock protein Hsp15 [Aliiglaciecola sp. CAU 1673]MDF2179212.1 ribosome-associated heat shock protein Hsp15 [Aliiglaciecola sp. CAU 1673]
MKSAEQDAVRLDKWLWAARFYKTRALAREMVQGGRVQYNGQRCKPSKTIELGAVLKVPQGSDMKEVVVKAISEQRRSAVLAQELYEETADSLKRREANAEARKAGALLSPRPEHKPDKKQRRDIIKLKHQ